MIGRIPILDMKPVNLRFHHVKVVRHKNPINRHRGNAPVIVERPLAHPPWRVELAVGIAEPRIHKRLVRRKILERIKIPRQNHLKQFFLSWMISML